MDKEIKICLVDLDGVIYDFVNYVLENVFESELKETDINTTDLTEYLGITKSEFWEKVDADNSFLNGEMYSWANDLIKICEKFSEEVYFCSNPGKHPSHWCDKKLWCEKYFPNIPVILMKDKHLLAKDGVVLVDDFNTNIDKFNEAGGIGVMFPQYWNRLNNIRREGDSLGYVECTLEDISTIGYKEWKRLKD